MNGLDATTGQAELVFAGVTDVGRRRSSNQDRFIAQALETRAGPLVLLAVADGMGGAAGGEIASAHAVDELLRVVGEADAPERDDGQILAEAIAAANRAVYDHARRDPTLHGMGTTVVAALVRGRTLVVGHVGDSRAYLLRRGALRRLTADHSWVAEQVRRGELTEEEAAISSFRNILTRSVGVSEQVEPELSPPLALEPGDIILLCSDGLHGVVDDATIARIAQAAAPEEAARRLVDLANERGGPDNITVVVARVSGVPAAAPTGAQPAPASLTPTPCEPSPPAPRHAGEAGPRPRAEAGAERSEAGAGTGVRAGEADAGTGTRRAKGAARPARAGRLRVGLALAVLAAVALAVGLVVVRRPGGRRVEIVPSPPAAVASPTLSPAASPPMLGVTVTPPGVPPLPTVPAVGALPPCPDTGMPSTSFCRVRPELPTSPQEMAARFGVSVECLLRVNAAQVVARLGGELPLLSPGVDYVIPAPEMCAQLP